MAETINTFSDDASRRIADAVRGWERQPQNSKPGKSGDSLRGLQVRFGITHDGGEAYPSAPASVFYWRPVDRAPESLTIGDQEIEETPHAAGRRLGTSMLGGYIAEGTIVKAYKIGGLWWLEPFGGVMFGESTSSISARSGSTLGSGTVKVYSLGTTWTVVQSEGADLVVTVRSVYTASVDSGKAVTFGIDAYSGLYGLLGADCS